MASLPMSMRIGAFVVIPVVLGAGVLALQGAQHAPEAIVAAPHRGAGPLDPVGEMQPSENGGTLPPDHPPIGAAAMGGTLPPNHPSIGAGAMGGTLPPDHPSIGGGASPHGALPPSASEPPALVWKMPASWQEAPSPSTMRLATYHAPGGVEVSVSRAGGETEANIQRWIAQFDDVGHEGRVEKTVRGLHVVTVDVAGTYVGGGMTMGASADPKPHWAMVGAIVESPSAPYFFKMTGPAAAVGAARPAFDHLVDSIAPIAPT
jgi:hypothetical protein